MIIISGEMFDMVYDIDLFLKVSKRLASFAVVDVGRVSFSNDGSPSRKSICFDFLSRYNLIKYGHHTQQGVSAKIKNILKIPNKRRV